MGRRHSEDGELVRKMKMSKIKAENWGEGTKSENEKTKSENGGGER